MNLNNRNKINIKGASFKILIKSTDIDKNINVDQITNKLIDDSEHSIGTKNEIPGNQQKEIVESKTEQDNISNEPTITEKKRSVNKTNQIFVNKDLDFIPEEDTDEEDEAEEKESTERNDKITENQSFVYDPGNVRYEDNIAIYTDPKSGYQYTWDSDKNEWIPKGNVQYGFEDDTHTYTDAEGVKYFWDKEKNAWFPKLDEDFMAQYQMSYGFVDNTLETNNKQAEPKKDIQKVETGIKRKAADPTWFDVKDEENKNVYVSNLPTDITEEEFIDFMQKCGLVMRDMATGKMKTKLYVVPGKKRW